MRALMFYRFVLRPFLWLFSAETAHSVAFGALRFWGALPGGKALLGLVYGYRNPAAEVKALGLTFPTPVGLAAGFDKDAEGYDALGALGFGFVEIGTVTGEAQDGNPQPRLFRVPEDRALINRMGFNNHGSAAAARRLAKGRRAVVGVNIGKTKVVPEDEAAADYVKSTERLAVHADYFVVNVSSPNTPGLRNLQAVDKLRPLLTSVREALDRASPSRRVPLLVKIAPDLADQDIDDVADLAIELGLDGIIATNTTISREGLETDAQEIEAIGAGGLSGAPLRQRALDVLERLRGRVGDSLVLISVGGITTVDDAWQRIAAGATLIQVYSAFIFEGPALPACLAKGLVARARAEGYPTVADAVGANGRSTWG